MICKVDGCGMKHLAFDLCRKHHARFKRHGTTDSKYNKDGYASLGGVKDIGKGRRGSLAVNVINDIKFKAKKRGKSWDLSHEEAFNLIISSCAYCGFKPEWPEKRVGIDRVFNDEGYHINNCVPCCFTCNSAKGDKTLEDFIGWINRVYAHMNK